MSNLKTILIGISIALAALGGTAATVELTASQGVDKIIADEVIPAEEVKDVMMVLKWESGDELERLKEHLLPLATTIKNNGKVDVLKLDELYALQSFGADVEIKMENGESFNDTTLSEPRFT